VTVLGWQRKLVILVLIVAALPIAGRASSPILAQQASPTAAGTPVASPSVPATATATLIPIAAQTPPATASPAAAQAPDLAETPAGATPISGGRLFVIPGERVFPEGIAYQEETREFFVGSLTDGAIYRGDLDTGDVAVFIPGRTDAVAAGLALGDGRLYAAGAGTGVVAVYDGATGQPLGEWTNNLAPNTFLNDVALTPAGDAFITDSFNPILYRLPATAFPGTGTPAPAPDVGQIEVFVDFTQTPFDLVQPGFNANGIVATLDGQFLLLVQSNTGSLFRVNSATGEVIQVDLGGEALTGGDGLALDGQRLYAVRDGQITIVELGPDFATGVVGESFSDPSFNTPTTIAPYDGCLLVVNSQLDAIQGQPQLPFTVSAIPVPVLAEGQGAAATPAVQSC
jgi:sugar lactone lactonase YvrE